MSRRKKTTPEETAALKAAEAAQAEADKEAGAFLRKWLIWATTNNNTTGKPAPIIDFAEYRKNKKIRLIY
jgi:hypothetical protein